MIDIGYGNNGMTDTYFLYKKIVDSKYISYEDEYKRFKACDTVDYNSRQNSAGVVTTDLNTLTIKTYSNLDFSPADKVKSARDGKVWIIENITIKDDGIMKEFCIRPRKITILTLSGGVDDDRNI